MNPTWIVRLDAPGDGPRLAVKDCIDVEGLPTTVGCQVVAEQASPAAADAPVVAAARRAGARIVGKTNLTELCWSASGVNSWSGTPVNPLDPGRLPGGVVERLGSGRGGGGGGRGPRHRHWRLGTDPRGLLRDRWPEDHLGPGAARRRVPAGVLHGHGGAARRGRGRGGTGHAADRSRLRGRFR